MNPTEAFRVLASVDRQYLLDELFAEGGELDLDELSQRVAARRHRVSTADVGDEEVDRARVRLVHIHLPVLADRNVVGSDWNDGTVTLAAGADVDDLLDAAEELDQWPPDRPLSRSSS